MMKKIFFVISLTLSFMSFWQTIALQTLGRAGQRGLRQTAGTKGLSLIQPSASSAWTGYGARAFSQQAAQIPSAPDQATALLREAASTSIRSRQLSPDQLWSVIDHLYAKSGEDEIEKLPLEALEKIASILSAHYPDNWLTKIVNDIVDEKNSDKLSKEIEVFASPKARGAIIGRAGRAITPSMGKSRGLAELVNKERVSAPTLQSLKAAESAEMKRELKAILLLILGGLLINSLLDPDSVIYDYLLEISEKLGSSEEDYFNSLKLKEFRDGFAYLQEYPVLNDAAAGYAARSELDDPFWDELVRQVGINIKIEEASLPENREKLKEILKKQLNINRLEPAQSSRILHKYEQLAEHFNQTMEDWSEQIYNNLPKTDQAKVETNTIKNKLPIILIRDVFDPVNDGNRAQSYLDFWRLIDSYSGDHGILMDARFARLIGLLQAKSKILREELNLR